MLQNAQTTVTWNTHSNIHRYSVVPRAFGILHFRCTVVPRGTAPTAACYVSAMTSGLMLCRDHRWAALLLRVRWVGKRGCCTYLQGSFLGILRSLCSDTAHMWRYTFHPAATCAHTDNLTPFMAPSQRGVPPSSKSSRSVALTPSSATQHDDPRNVI